MQTVIKPLIKQIQANSRNINAEAEEMKNFILAQNEQLGIMIWNYIIASMPQKSIDRRYNPIICLNPLSPQ